MQAEKKKLLILGILAVVILCVGAFSLTGGSKPAVQPAVAHHSRHSSAVETTVPGTTAPIATATSTGPATTAYPGGATPYGQPATSAGAPNPAAAAANGTKVAMAPVAEQDFAERDPFDGRKYIPDDKKQDSPPAAPAPAPAITPKKGSRIAPMQVGFDGKGLPSADGKLALSGLNAPKADDFDYSVTGVITGDHPAAVFVDSKGDQRLITTGGSLDGDTKVVAITRGTVTVEHHGKKRTLSVGADTPTEKR